MNVRIVYPMGGGGNWLDDVVWHLENGNFEPTKPQIVFDHGRDSSIKFEHALFEEQQMQHRSSFVEQQPHMKTIVFSTKYVFNIYVNQIYKFLYLRKKLKNVIDSEHLFTLSDNARWLISNQKFQTTYCEKIDIDYSLLITNADGFVDQLFAVLDSINFKYTVNRQYVLDSIKNYLGTCKNVNDIFGNMNSLPWLGFCHAIALIDNLDIEVIKPKFSIEQIAQVLMPHYEYFTSRIDPLIVKWKELN